MTILYFQYLAIFSNENLPKSAQIVPKWVENFATTKWTIKILPKIFKFLPKRWIFAKSGHIERVQKWNLNASEDCFYLGGGGECRNTFCLAFLVIKWANSDLFLFIFFIFKQHLTEKIALPRTMVLARLLSFWVSTKANNAEVNSLQLSITTLESFQGSSTRPLIVYFPFLSNKFYRKNSGL